MDNKKNLMYWSIGTLLLLCIAIYPNIVYAIINNSGISYIITSIIFACPIIGIVAILPRKWMYCIATILLTIMSIIDLTMIDLYNAQDAVRLEAEVLARRLADRDARYSRDEFRRELDQQVRSDVCDPAVVHPDAQLASGRRIQMPSAIFTDCRA